MLTGCHMEVGGETYLLQVKHMIVFFCLLVLSALKRNTVKGRLHILHSAPGIN
jgi:hypothetical protein